MDIMKTIEAQKADVIAFMEAMGQTPSIELQLNLVIEEAGEMLVAGVALSEDKTVSKMEDFLKEAADVLYVMVGSIVAAERTIAAGGIIEPSDLTLKAGFLIELVEKVLVDAGEAFLDDQMLIEAFNRVHASNMSKLGPDGKAVFNEDGKIMKSSLYMPPNLSDLAVTALERLLFWQEQFEDFDAEDEAVAA